MLDASVVMGVASHISTDWDYALRAQWGSVKNCEKAKLECRDGMHKRLAGLGLDFCVSRMWQP